MHTTLLRLRIIDDVRPSGAQNANKKKTSNKRGFQCRSFAASSTDVAMCARFCDANVTDGQTATTAAIASYPYQYVFVCATVNEKPQRLSTEASQTVRRTRIVVSRGVVSIVSNSSGRIEFDDCRQRSGVKSHSAHCVRYVGQHKTLCVRYLHITHTHISDNMHLLAGS